jgi:hypothetical protein
LREGDAKRGLVVRVWTYPTKTAIEDLQELEELEEGHFGNYFN